MGTLWDKMETKFFVADKASQKVYLSNAVARGDMSDFAGYDNQQIISYIYPGKYENMENMDFPEDVKQHVANENFVLCLYSLK
jgi:hypothetical protein